jgi:fructoselysine-6-P-deglycase FrlB-like protein
VTRSLQDTHLAAEVATQPDNWVEAAQLALQYKDVLPRPGERVAVIGCGTSLHMARGYATLREAAGQGETDAWPASAARLGRRYDRVVAISRSGTTTEVLDALREHDGRCPVTVVTSSAGTPILAWGDAILVPQFPVRHVGPGVAAHAPG